jgi:hypothetical protein
MQLTFALMNLMNKCFPLTKYTLLLVYFFPTSFLFSQNLQFAENAVSLYAGGAQGLSNGSRLTAQFNLPTGIASDTFGNLYVADFSNHLIRKITSTGVVSTFAGSGIAGSTDALGSLASFNSPTGLSCDLSGNVYVADQFNNKINKKIEDYNLLIRDVLKNGINDPIVVGLD